MQDIRLKSMHLRNFKGIRELDIRLDGRDMNVSGDNGTGKTTIIDGFMWLLFGKDSLGRADFGIKPTDKEGNVIHQLETSVEAVFTISGVERTFKKTLEEVWTRKRGAAEAEFTRNENKFFIDGVPKKKTEYTAAIKEIIEEETFKILTNPLYFNEAINWKDRRKVLLSICGEVSDADVISANPELAPLVPMLNGRSVSDFKDITASGMKRVNKELEAIPVKIDEAERAKPSAESMEADLTRKAALEQEIEALRQKGAGITNGSEVAQKRQEVQNLRRELDIVGMGYDPTADALRREIGNLENQRNEFRRRSANIADSANGYATSIARLRERRAKLGEQWDQVNGERFTDNICPTCHRELPADEVEAKRNAFNANRAERLDKIEAENDSLAGAIQTEQLNQIEAENALTAAKSKIDELTAAIEAKEEELRAYKAQKAKDDEAKREAIRADIARIQGEIQSLEQNNAPALAEIDAKITELRAELRPIEVAIANQETVARQNRRIEELKAQQGQLAQEYTTLEKGLYLAERFIVAKVHMLNDRINQKFRYAKFKLFDQQINGGINEVCEVTYQGIPYKDLNRAACLNIGLDIINTISAHYGITAPILLDNAESVNRLFHTDAQQIRFYVSNDTKLTFGEV